jgi:hypothetical protein
MAQYRIQIRRLADRGRYRRGRASRAGRRYDLPGKGIGECRLAGAGTPGEDHQERFLNALDPPQHGLRTPNQLITLNQPARLAISCHDTIQGRQLLGQAD